MLPTTKVKLLCTDGEPHEWHTAEGGYSCGECGEYLDAEAFKARHDLLERALSTTERERQALAGFFWQCRVAVQDYVAKTVETPRLLAAAQQRTV